jgi:hypothetical protein
MSMQPTLSRLETLAFNPPPYPESNITVVPRLPSFQEVQNNFGRSIQVLPESEINRWKIAFKSGFENDLASRNSEPKVDRFDTDFLSRKPAPPFAFEIRVQYRVEGHCRKAVENYCLTVAKLDDRTQKETARLLKSALFFVRARILHAAMHSVNEALDLEPENEAALELKREIDWFQLAERDRYVNKLQRQKTHSDPLQQGL